ncbi:hypothetical protein Cgig2_015107 [Carnegiea gigantea]|uniref:PLAT domain-containing protein n=1 Tax=Carnegiea gigantea TaxID=171969 RepID=A0A9Q1KRT2_9CARY|nr:hypothetical protein Cgig2_015107 [Carnegiea gigantea]
MSQGCTYRVEVATGDRGNAGTDAKVSLSLCTNSKDCFVQVSNLAQYGSRGPSYDYFERNNRDIFEIPTTIECVDICRMIIGHDDSGYKSGWYLDYVKVEAYNDNGIKQSESEFPVYRWLATDESPYTLQADVNHCPPWAHIDDDDELRLILMVGEQNLMKLMMNHHCRDDKLGEKALFILMNPAFFSLLIQVLSDDETKSTLLKGLNDYRGSKGLPGFLENKQADCLAEKLIENDDLKLKERTCAPGHHGSYIEDHKKVVENCDMDPKKVSHGIFLPVCVPNLNPDLLLGNYTKTTYQKLLEGPKFNAVGFASKDDWVVVVLGTQNDYGSLASRGAGLGYELIHCFLPLLLGFAYMVC